MKSYYQGRLLRSREKIKQAYEKYENIIFSGFSTLNFVLSTMAGLALRENDIGYARFCQGRYRQLHIHWKWENIMSIRQCLILYVQGKM